MMNALTISEVSKTYPGFTLDHVSFTVPQGAIVGLIGENGAGKSTILNATLGLIAKESGTINILGSECFDNATKEQVGVVFDGSNYPDVLSVFWRKFTRAGTERITRSCSSALVCRRTKR